MCETGCRLVFLDSKEYEGTGKYGKESQKVISLFQVQ